MGVRISQVSRRSRSPVITRALWRSARTQNVNVVSPLNCNSSGTKLVYESRGRRRGPTGKEEAVPEVTRQRSRVRSHSLASITRRTSMSSEARSAWLDDMTRREALRRAIAGGAVLVRERPAGRVRRQRQQRGRWRWRRNRIGHRRRRSRSCAPAACCASARPAAARRTRSTRTSRRPTRTSCASGTCTSRWRSARRTSASSQMLVAESIEPVGSKPDAWTVRLKDGVEFHNGKTVTADDVIFSLQRITDPKDPKVGNCVDQLHRPRQPQEDRRADRPHPAEAHERGVPGRPRPVLQRDRPDRLRPEEAGRHRAVQVPVVLARPAQRVRRRTRTTGRAGKPYADQLIDHRLPRRHGAHERAARRAGRGDQQPAGGAGRERPGQPEPARC